MIAINAPQIGKEEIAAVVEVLKSGAVTHGLGAGIVVTKFEDEFSKYVKAKNSVAVNTGTAALHLAAAAVGVGPGDEVILPSFTFVATAEAVVMTGARPVFVDVDPATYNISPNKVEDAITSNTKAVIPVGLYGLSADMQPIREIADKHGLAIVEDAAQAHGASYRGKCPGEFADAACWSFYASKNMTTGEGGMITTNHLELAEKMRMMRSHGEKEKYKSVMLGHNYHMSEIQAAIGRVQLRRLPSFSALRRKNSARLASKLVEVEDLQLPKEPESYRHSWYLFTVRLKKEKRKGRDEVVQKLRRKGVGAEVYYTNPIHQMPYYEQFSSNRLLETEKAAEQVLSLPVHPGVTAEQVEFIGESLLSLVR